MMKGASKCGEIFWHEEKGYGYVVFDRDFTKSEPITCLDAINDWMLGMTNEYTDHIKRSQMQFEQLRSQARRVTKKI